MMPEKHVRQVGEAAIEAIERQDWLDVVGDRLQKAVAAAFQAGGDTGRRVRDFLHGTWLGHPLHPALTDIPLGAWTTALALDAAGDKNKGMARAADAAIGIGIAGAVGAAVTGLADWHHTTGGDRRVGLGHAMLNTAALALYVTSFALRRSGARDAGRALSAVVAGVGSSSNVVVISVTGCRGRAILSTLACGPARRPRAQFVGVVANIRPSRFAVVVGHVSYVPALRSPRPR